VWSVAGGVSVGFHHGHHVDETNLPNRTFLAFFAYDEFLCPNKIAAHALKASVIYKIPKKIFVISSLFFSTFTYLNNLTP